MAMNHVEHGQQIYSMILAGWASSGRPLPGAAESATYAEMCLNYAKTFATKAKEMADKNQ